MEYFMMPEKGKPHYALESVRRLLVDFGIQELPSIYGRFAQYSLDKLSPDMLKKLNNLECVSFFKPREEVDLGFYLKHNLENNLAGFCVFTNSSKLPREEIQFRPLKTYNPDNFPTGF